MSYDKFNGSPLSEIIHICKRNGDKGIIQAELTFYIALACMICACLEEFYEKDVEPKDLAGYMDKLIDASEVLAVDCNLRHCGLN